MTFKTPLTSAHRLWLAVLLALYLVVAVIYSVITPIFEASDELWHFPMVDYIATNNFQLPIQNPEQHEIWRQEGSQPPLYYMVAALFITGIDTSDLEHIRRINPHSDIGLVHPDGNANMITHRVDAEVFPWTNTVLAVHIVRFFSIALSFGTLWITFALARELFPSQPLIALGAVALNAFLPMFLFISGSVNNDNLSNLLGNLLTLLLVKLIKQRGDIPLKSYVILGIAMGAGLLAKLNIGFLIPVTVLVFIVLSARQRSLRPLILGGLISGGLTILIAGWWYLRNFQLYDDPTGLNVFLDIVGRRFPPATLMQLWGERSSFTQAYWGFFGGVNVPLNALLYQILDLFGGIALISAVLFLLNRILKKAWHRDQWLAAGITLIWCVITFVSYIRWTADTPASQGRLVFGALSSLSIWMIVGWTWVFKSTRIQASIIAVISTVFFILAVTIPFTVIAPAYSQPEFIEARPTEVIFSDPQGGSIALQAGSFELETPMIRPGDYVQFFMNWQVESPLSRNWSLFTHLTSIDSGVIIAQRDVYPGDGSIATSDLSAGTAWRNHIAINVPNNVYAPMDLQIVVGWYDLETGERLTLENGEDALILGNVQLNEHESEWDVPNPMSINFNHQIELVGYSLSEIAPLAGTAETLTLYWRAIQPQANDYIVFAHIIDPLTLYTAAGSDAMPAGWERPTSTWELGEIIEDVHILEIDPNAPPGVYELEIGFYLQDDEGNFNRLRVIELDGNSPNDYAYLSRIRILPREE